MRVFSVILLAITLLLLPGCHVIHQNVTTSNIAPSTTQGTITDLWDVEHYEQLDGITSLNEINDKIDGVRTWQLRFNNDGCSLVGYLSIPEACISEKIPYSCLVYARGGTMYYGALTYEEVASFSRGLNTVVISTEYRGRGACTGKDENGGAELYDFLKLIDYCEEFAFLDMNRLYMMGPSRGGMTTYQAIRVDDRIKKAFVHSGVADMFLSIENRPDLHENYFKMIGGSPEEVPEEYEKRSAVYWADEFKCPVLIFHSKGDPRVSYAEAEKLVAALEAAGKEYRFVSYDDDVHGSHPEDWAIVKEWCDFGPAGEE